MLQMKVVQNLVSSKKLSGSISLSPPPPEWSYGAPNNCHVLEWKSRFILGLNAAKSTNFIEKCFKLKLYKIKFSTKNLLGAGLYLPQEWSYGAPKICHFWNALKWEIRFI